MHSTKLFLVALLLIACDDGRPTPLRDAGIPSDAPAALEDGAVAEDSGPLHDAEPVDAHVDLDGGPVIVDAGEPMLDASVSTDAGPPTGACMPPYEVWHAHTRTCVYIGSWTECTPLRWSSASELGGLLTLASQIRDRTTPYHCDEPDIACYTGLTRDIYTGPDGNPVVRPDWHWYGNPAAVPLSVFAVHIVGTATPYDRMTALKPHGLVLHRGGELVASRYLCQRPTP